MTQTEWVLKALKRRPITALDAFNGCGCMRLAARICDLRSSGVRIKSETVKKNGKMFSLYKLERKNGKV
jgi:hypothetical protein